MFPPSSSLFLSSSFSHSSRLARRRREIAGVGQGLLTVRIWLQCVNCFILKTLKLMPVCASGGLLSMCASAFLKVESGGMEVGRNRKEVEENCDHLLQHGVHGRIWASGATIRLRSDSVLTLLIMNVQYLLEFVHFLSVSCQPFCFLPLRIGLQTPSQTPR